MIETPRDGNCCGDIVSMSAAAPVADWRQTAPRLRYEQGQTQGEDVGQLSAATQRRADGQANVHWQPRGVNAALTRQSIRKSASQVTSDAHTTEGKKNRKGKRERQ